MSYFFFLWNPIRKGILYHDWRINAKKKKNIGTARTIKLMSFTPRLIYAPTRDISRKHLVQSNGFQPRKWNFVIRLYTQMQRWSEKSPLLDNKTIHFILTIEALYFVTEFLGEFCTLSWSLPKPKLYKKLENLYKYIGRIIVNKR